VGEDLSPAESRQRRLDIDWLRILAFALLILYHVGMYYVTWDWHVKSPHASPVLEPLMLLANPWRLVLLFLVSGVATAYIARRVQPGKLARSRAFRLGVPLAFAMAVIIVPQAYFEVVLKGGYDIGYLEFWRRYLQADGTFCRGSDCLVLPTWNHLWFVAYLLVYTLLLAVLLRFAPNAAPRAAAALDRHLVGWRLLAWPFLYLAAIRPLIAVFGSTHALVNDWYNHALYAAAFGLGFVLAHATRVWEEMERLRWAALLVGVACYGFLAWYFTLRSDPTTVADALRWLQRAIYALDQWASIVAACGFARRHFRRDGPVRRYLTDAIFPFYIAHQTAIIIFAVWLRPLGLHPAGEGLLLVVLVVAACLATYEGVRRVRWLRPLFGLKGAPRRTLAVAD
jgi:glucans biosynthesis protein C